MDPITQPPILAKPSAGLMACVGYQPDHPVAPAPTAVERAISGHTAMLGLLAILPPEACIMSTSVRLTGVSYRPGVARIEIGLYSHLEDHAQRDLAADVAAEIGLSDYEFKNDEAPRHEFTGTWNGHEIEIWVHGPAFDDSLDDLADLIDAVGILVITPSNAALVRQILAQQAREVTP